MIGLLILAISYCSRLKSSRSIPEHLIGVCYIDLGSSQLSDMCGINFNKMGYIFFSLVLCQACVQKKNCKDAHIVDFKTLHKYHLPR